MNLKNKIKLVENLLSRHGYDFSTDEIREQVLKFVTEEEFFEEYKKLKEDLKISDGFYYCPNIPK